MGCGPISTGCIQPNCSWVSRFPGFSPSVAPCSSSEARFRRGRAQELVESGRLEPRCLEVCLLVLGVPLRFSQSCVCLWRESSGYSRLFFEEASGLKYSEKSSPRLLGVPLYSQSRLVARGFDDLWVTPDFCRDGLGLLPRWTRAFAEIVGQLCSGLNLECMPVVAFAEMLLSSSCRGV